MAVLAALLVAVAIVDRLRAQSAGFDWDAFASTFSRLDWGWLSLGCVMAYATYYGRALRWAVRTVVGREGRCGAGRVGSYPIPAD